MRKIEDERIVAEKRKINSKAFGICFLALWGILLYRQFILQQDITEYIDIFLLTLGVSMYVTVHSVFKGFYLTYRNKIYKKKVKLISALVGSAAFVIVQFFVADYNLTNWNDILKLIASFIVFLLAWITAQSLLFRISDKKANEDLEE